MFARGLEHLTRDERRAVAFGVPIGTGLLLGSAVGFLLGSFVFALPRRRRMYEQAFDRHAGRRRKQPRSG